MVHRVWFIPVVVLASAVLAGTGYLIVSRDGARLASGPDEVAPSSSQAAPPPARPAAKSPPCPIQLRDVTAETGIAFCHTDGSSGKYYIAETVTAGVATFDFDADGWIDIYLPNGAPLPGAPTDPPPRHALYRNRGDWQFQDVSELANVVCHGFGMGAVAGDYDQDGFADLYVSNFGPKVLYHNNGDGTFSAVTDQAGVGDDRRLGAGVGFLDADRDGDLDLFVANYVQFDVAQNMVLTRHGFPEYVGPRAYPPEKLTLYRNNGDSTFADVNGESGIGRHPGKGMGLVCADYDQDGDTDIFVLNDVYQNFCFENDGTGRFEEVGLANGFKYNAEGVPLGSMGVDCGDYDNDGWLDFYQTSYQREMPVLFHNLGTGILEDVTTRSGAGDGTAQNVKWGCGFVDFDNDSHRDLFVALGHLQDTIDRWDPPTTYAARNVLLRNTGRGTFVNVTDQCGDGLLAVSSSRGAAFDDLDNDGDVDAVILNSRDRPTVLRNMDRESGGSHHWLQVQLRGVQTGRDGVGARVQVTAGDLTLVDEVHAGRGYQGHFGSRLHFGLGRQDRVDRVEVHWIGGRTEVFSGVPVDRLANLIEGRGQPSPAASAPPTSGRGVENGGLER